MSLATIILAAGKGTRMRSSQPKVLHRLANIPLLEHVYIAAKSLKDCSVAVIYGHGGDIVKSSLSNLECEWVEQKDQLGTGHAVKQAESFFSESDRVLVLYGDVPLTSKDTLESLINNSKDSGFSILTVVLNEPHGYGRIVRDNEGNIQKIVEEKDANDFEKKIKESNSGIMCISSKNLVRWLANLSNSNSQGEYYLTDIVEMAVNDGVNVGSTTVFEEFEVLGVNNRLQLAQLERYYQIKNAEKLMLEGITFSDPERFDMRGNLSHGIDILIDCNVIIEGDVVLGNNVKIGPNTVLINCVVGDNVEILANCVLDNSTVESGSIIGPYARLRPDTHLKKNVRIGNFVEIKKSNIDEGSKINHLSYIGDSEIGSGVNIGAGTITCNYDGVNKFKTIIGNNVFVGSDTQIIAPVMIANGATIAAGTTVTKDVPAEQLTISRSKQVSIKAWKRPTKLNK